MARLRLPSGIPCDDLDTGLEHARWRLRQWQLLGTRPDCVEAERANIAHLELLIAKRDVQERVRPVRVYTAGYGNRSVDDLFRVARGLNAYILDIRYSPMSRRPEWRYTSLQGRFRVRYTHCAALGNRNYRKSGEPVMLADADNGLWDVQERLDQGQTLILLCGCGDYNHCHRAFVASLLHVRGIETREVDWHA